MNDDDEDLKARLEAFPPGTSDPLDSMSGVGAGALGSP